MNSYKKRMHLKKGEKNMEVKQWDNSYNEKQNFVWYPENEMVRFLSKYVIKKVDVEKFDRKLFKEKTRLVGLDFGCGIGRGVFLMDDFGIKSFGVDISEVALGKARELAQLHGRYELNDNFYNISNVSIDSVFLENSIDVVVSHGVFDSMTFASAVEVLKGLHKLMSKGGYFYLDLISGDDSNHIENFCGEEIVKDEHEKGTVQSYFNVNKINNLIKDTSFEIRELKHVKSLSILDNKFNSRYYVVLKKQDF